MSNFSSKASPIHILLANVPLILSEIFEVVLDKEPDMRVIAKVTGNIPTLFSAGWHVDVVILGADTVAPLPNIGKHLLSQFPHLRILVVSSTGDESVMYWLGLYQERLNDVSMRSLVQSIRHTMAMDGI